MHDTWNVVSLDLACGHRKTLALPTSTIAAIRMRDRDHRNVRCAECKTSPKIIRMSWGGQRTIEGL